jgi:putative ABC transport system substrate-binding protein
MGNYGLDPVATGLVASLARPGGNVTGFHSLARGLGAKRVDLLKTTVPSLSPLAVLHGTGLGTGGTVDDIESAARLLGVRAEAIPVETTNDLESAFDTASQQADAVLVFGTQPFSTDVAGVVALAAERGLPAIYDLRAFADVGGLMAYAANLSANYYKAAAHVGRILRGASPADLPIEGPTSFEFVVNLKTAHALGLTIPLSVLGQVSEIIA